MGGMTGATSSTPRSDGFFDDSGRIDERGDDVRWGAVWTRPQVEHRVRRSLLDAGFPALNFRLRTSAGLRPLLPRYVLVMFDVYDLRAWHVIRGVSGVSSILGGEAPRVIPDHVVDDLSSLADDDGVVERGEVRSILAPLLPGDEVRVLDGFLGGRTAQVVWSSDEHAAIDLAPGGLSGSLLQRITIPRVSVELTRSRAEVNDDLTRSDYLVGRIRRVALRGDDAAIDPRLGCTISHLTYHVQSQFRDGMTWANYGSVWRLDHRRALSPSFPRERYDRYDNLRPLPIGDLSAKMRRDAAITRMISSGND